jgi:DNA-binding NarL/FixJ family response regulator
MVPATTKEMKMSTKSKSQAAMIRSLLSKKVSAEKIVERVRKAIGGNPTVGYVNWIAATK